MLKRTAFLSVLIITALMVMFLATPTGIYSQDATPSPSPAPTATPVVADVGTGSIQLVYWNGLTGGDGGTMQQMVNAFVEANPDISVHSESHLWDVMFQKLTAAFVAGEPPDVFVLHTQEIPQFAELGILRPSDDMFAANGGTLPMEDYSGIEATKFGDSYYGVLLDNHGFGTWLNLDLFKAAGVDENVAPPTNAEEFIALAKQLTIDANGNHPDDPDFDVQNVQQWGTAIDWVRVQFLSHLAQFGGSIISEDGTQVTINEEPGKQALQFMYDMIHTHKIAPNPASVNGPNAFQAGKVAMMPTGTWYRNVLVDQYPDIRWKAWPMIQVGTQNATWVSAHVIFIASTLEDETKLNAAKKFVEYLSNNDIMWATSGHVPARISSQAKLDENTYPSNIIFGKGFQEHGAFEPQHVSITELTAAYEPELTAALNDQKSIDQALSDAATRMQAILDRAR